MRRVQRKEVFHVEPHTVLWTPFGYAKVLHRTTLEQLVTTYLPPRELKAFQARLLQEQREIHKHIQNQNKEKEEQKQENKQEESVEQKEQREEQKEQRVEQREEQKEESEMIEKKKDDEQKVEEEKLDEKMEQKVEEVQEEQKKQQKAEEQEEEKKYEEEKIEVENAEGKKEENIEKKEEEKKEEKVGEKMENKEEEKVEDKIEEEKMEEKKEENIKQDQENEKEINEPLLKEHKESQQEIEEEKKEEEQKEGEGEEEQKEGEGEENKNEEEGEQAQESAEIQDQKGEEDPNKPSEEISQSLKKAIKEAQSKKKAEENERAKKKAMQEGRARKAEQEKKLAQSLEEQVAEQKRKKEEEEQKKREEEERKREEEEKKELAQQVEKEEEAAREEAFQAHQQSLRVYENPGSVEMVQLKTVYGAQLHTHNTNLFKKIVIFIKTFFGERDTVELMVDVNSTINCVKNTLVSRCGAWQKNLYGLRLIYPMGILSELKQGDQTLQELEIPHKANLILLYPQKKGSLLKLSGGNLKVEKQQECEYQSVLGDIQYSSGRNYWEIKIEKYMDDDNIFIGVARPDIQLDVNPVDNLTFYGYMPLCARKFGPGHGIINYGQICQVGDVIGVLLEYRMGQATLSFYRNSHKLGPAFCDLDGSFRPALCLLYGEVTLDPKATVPL